VTYQLKILTTAGFSVLLLGRRLSAWQWTSLFLLTCGVALVQLPDQAAVTTATQDQALGLLAVLTACFSSGFAGVYYEKLVKESSQLSLVIRNLQLGLFSLFFALTGMLINDWEAIRNGGRRESSVMEGITKEN
jgi:solute carrier family 35 (UDP-sugar transporter), member A1/2/3